MHRNKVEPLYHTEDKVDQHLSVRAKLLKKLHDTGFSDDVLDTT